MGTSHEVGTRVEVHNSKPFWTCKTCGSEVLPDRKHGFVHPNFRRKPFLNQSWEQQGFAGFTRPGKRTK